MWILDAIEAPLKWQPVPLAGEPDLQTNSFYFRWNCEVNKWVKVFRFSNCKFNLIEHCLRIYFMVKVIHTVLFTIVS